MLKPIEVNNLHHRYGRKVIYDELNFSIEAGKIYGLLGKNGVGKTTLIKILMGFLRPSAGHCQVFGEDSHNLSPATRARIGLLFEGHLKLSLQSSGLKALIGIIGSIACFTVWCLIRRHRLPGIATIVLITLTGIYGLIAVNMVGLEDL